MVCDSISLSRIKLLMILTEYKSLSIETVFQEKNPALRTIKPARGLLGK